MDVIVYPLQPVVEAHLRFFDAPPVAVLDVGSRDGDDCAWLVTQLEAKHGIAVEPRPGAVEMIRLQHPEFAVYEAAASEFTGAAPFVVFEGPDVSPGLAGSASLNTHRGALHPTHARYTEVPTVRLEDLALPVPLVLKVDTEGHTMPVLRGLGERLNDVRVAHLETETLARDAWGEPANNHAVAYFMRARGFKLFDVSYPWGESIEDQVWVNAVTCDQPAEFVEPELAR